MVAGGGITIAFPQGIGSIGDLHYVNNGIPGKPIHYLESNLPENGTSGWQHIDGQVEAGHAVGGRPVRVIKGEAVGDVIIQLDRAGVQGALINHFNGEGNIIARIEGPVPVQGKVERQVEGSSALHMDERYVMVVFIGSGQCSIHRAGAIADDGIIRLGAGGAAGIIERQAIRRRIEVVQSENISSMEDLCPVNDGISAESSLDPKGNIQRQRIPRANIRQGPSGESHPIFIEPGAVIFQLHRIGGVVIHQDQEVSRHPTLVIHRNGIIDDISGSERRGSQFLVEFHAQSQVKPGRYKACVERWIHLSFVSGGKVNIRQPVGDGAGHIG